MLASKRQTEVTLLSLLPDSHFKLQQQYNSLLVVQAQTLPDATPPIGKIHPFSKMAVTFEPLMGF
jgi:hypothetical protein